MKIVPLIVLALAITVVFVSCQNAESSKPTKNKVIVYDEDENSIFCNPERGWQKTLNPDFATNKQYPDYTRAELEAIRDQNMTLVDKFYLIMPFKHSEISQEFFDSFDHDMEMIRRVGLKAVVRFSYNYAGDKDMTDAPVEQVLMHIAQIKPYLKKNYDVIAFLEAGFIGKWAEWHGTSNNLLGGKWHVDVNENTRKIYAALMDALPKERMIAIRYIPQIQELTRSKNCEKDVTTISDFTEEEAFSGTNRARTGRHDDWVFGESESNMGTWSVESEIRECQKKYLRDLSKYVPVTTGETQEISEFNRTTSPISFFEDFHFASLSVNPGGGGDEILNSWRSNGTFDEMARRFGYRFVLHEATFPTQCKKGGNMFFSFKIENKGFGGVYNPRLFEVVLRNQKNGKVYHFNITQSSGNELDPRFWFRENGVMIKTVDLKLENVPAGSYEVFMNLPDPAEKLYGRPEFSIRLANHDVWEEETGFNKFNAIVKIK